MTTAVETARSPLASAERQRLIRRARLLAWSSLVWMTADGVTAW
ncbi:MAG: hypothetical protein ACRDNP_03095 [Gaiellaceae bacterium]